MLILNIWMTSLIALSTFLFNPIQDGGGVAKKASLYQFFLYNFCKRRN